MAKGWSDYRPWTFRRLKAELSGWRPVQQIEEGSMLLPLHGIAYRRWQDAGAMTAVMPLNVLWAWSRRFFVWMRFQAPGGMVWLDDKLFEAYNLGSRDAHKRYAKWHEPRSAPNQ